jgi:hypothetical protein
MTIAVTATLARAPPHSSRTLDHGVAVLRDGNRVAYAQGLPDAIRDVTLRGLIGLPYDLPAPQPPFVAVHMTATTRSH